MDDLQRFASQAAMVGGQDQDQAEAMRIAGVLTVYGRQLRAGGMPDKLVAAVVVQAGAALWGGCGCEDE